MDKIFIGKYISYNLDEFKRQLTCKNIYLDSYEYDDVFYFLNLADKYNLDLSKLNIEVIDNEKSEFYLRGSCETNAAMIAHDHLVDMLEAIKLNLTLDNYNANIDMSIPKDVDSMLKYIDENIILIQYAVQVDMLEAIKLNLTLDNYNANIDMSIPKDVDSMLKYIDENIILIQYAVQEDDSDFHSFYLNYEGIPKPVIFINSNEFIDNQNFYLAHELYHHFYNDGDEIKADKFAANLLLPEWLLNKFDIATAMNDIMKIREITRAPYKAIVRALFERGKLSQIQFNELYNFNVRELNKYCPELNIKPNKCCVSKFIASILINNFERGRISKGDYLDFYHLLYENKYCPELNIKPNKCCVSKFIASILINNFERGRISKGDYLDFYHLLYEKE